MPRRRRDRSYIFGPAPDPPPAGYGRNKRLAYEDGWDAAMEGASTHAAPDGPEWREQAWLTGHAAYHQWLQAHRVRACDREDIEQ